MDVSSLYTSMPHHAALSAIRHYLDQRQDPQIPTTTFLRLTELLDKTVSSSMGAFSVRSKE
ncbi:hypothetical protein HOLleu_13641 [Holothuria leucospilota]|uniref:Uncharacterized protein n=1 Tax=Holothuria leucospilota TaxID=206669 RepID=A0A9Q1HEV8_HOLLE|nr:hypothetical protein HOLleu_13641 [Holothuria leucospilota]